MVSGLNGHGSHANGHASPSEAGRGAYARLKAIVLLGGSVRSGELGRAIGRSLLDLPVNDSQSVLSLWQDNAEELAAAIGAAHLQLRIVLSQSAREPTIPVPRHRVRLTVERDAREYRGTGGVLRDLADSYAPDDLILVANAAQILGKPLVPLAEVLFSAPGSVSCIAHKDGTPCGLFLVKCAALASIRDIGFLDFKEQVLPKLGAAGHTVNALMTDSTTGVPVRTLGGYLSGVRSFTRVRAGLPMDTDPFHEDWSATFAIVEPGATVDPTATIHDSVVLKGARVAKRAVIVRSVLGPGASVDEGETIADRAVGAAEEGASGGRA
jgi:hypothetical protein